MATVALHLARCRAPDQTVTAVVVIMTSGRIGHVRLHINIAKILAITETIVANVKVHLQQILAPLAVIIRIGQFVVTQLAEIIVPKRVNGTAFWVQVRINHHHLTR